MRCEHVIEKKSRLTKNTRLRTRRQRIKSVSRKLLIGSLTCHVY